MHPKTGALGSGAGSPIFDGWKAGADSTALQTDKHAGTGRCTHTRTHNHSRGPELLEDEELLEEE
jgi:hypothetical protein